MVNIQWAHKKRMLTLLVSSRKEDIGEDAGGGGGGRELTHCGWECKLVQPL
jgi:hypothetical protein